MCVCTRIKFDQLGTRNVIRWNEMEFRLFCMLRITVLDLPDVRYFSGLGRTYIHKRTKHINIKYR